MNNKKWYENIPEQGVLCRCPTFGNLVEITEMTEKDIRTYEKLGVMPVPITPKEWWNFAPFIDVNDQKPEFDKRVLVVAVGNDREYLCIARRTDRFDGGYAVGSKSIVYNVIKWLPLPEDSQ